MLVTSATALRSVFVYALFTAGDKHEHDVQRRSDARPDRDDRHTRTLRDRAPHQIAESVNRGRRLSDLRHAARTVLHRFTAAL